MSDPAITLVSTPAVRQQTISHSFVRLVGAVPVAALLGYLYQDVLYALLLECWTDPAASQGLLIPPLAAYLTYIRWRLVAAHTPKVETAGILGVAAGALLLVLGKLGAEFFLTRISFVVLIAGLIWTFWGLPRLRALSLPLLLLASMIPLPALIYGTLSGPLRLFASNAAERIAEAAGVTLYREGNTLFLANISLGVEEACSGLTSLSSIVIAALLVGYTLCRRPVSRFAIVAASVPVAVAANVVRVAGTAILSDEQPAYALGFYHAFSGWVVFAIGLCCLYAIAITLSRFTERSSSGR